MIEEEKIQHINIDLLIPNKKQPRRIFNDESLQELSLSIKEYGIINPILVRPYEDKYEIIAGERRARAAKIAGLKEVPVIIKKINDESSAELALIENLQRENITPIEEAKAYEEIMSISSMTEDMLSRKIGKSQSAISNKLRLLKLPNYVQEALLERKISERHARSLLTVDSEEKQKELLDRVIKERLTVKELDTIIKERTMTDDEIQSAIKDIMDTLKISDFEEKEEKESDNMNDGNFFPNTNQNMGVPTAQVAMPQMGGIPTEMPAPMPMPGTQMSSPASDPQVVLPTVPVAPTVESAQPPLPTLPPVEVNPIPDFGQNMVTNVEPTPQMVDAPLFGGTPAAEPAITPEINMPSLEQNATPTVVEPTIPEPPAPVVEQSVEIPQPVAVSPLPEAVQTVEAVPTPIVTPNKLNQIQEFLNNNGVNYKTYSNDSGHCIIIEL